MKELQMEHSGVLNALTKNTGASKIDDTWRTYSDNLIIRDISLKESFRNALV